MVEPLSNALTALTSQATNTTPGQHHSAIQSIGLPIIHPSGTSFFGEGHQAGN